MRAPLRQRLQATFLGTLAVLALAAGWLPAMAASLSVGDLRLEYTLPWQRADAEEETRAQSVILRREDAALTVLLPRHQARLRTPEERFYRQLETAWLAQYGQKARLDWLDAAGLRWRMVRRPSLERADAVVFHLVTVIDGRAHHLLAYAPAAAADLPEAVVQLLTAPAHAQAGQDSPAPSHHPPTTALPTVWRLDRVLRIQPGQPGLDRVMRMEQRALRGDGGITGLALQAQEQGLNAFLEGFVWVPGPDRREVKREFVHRWEVSWSAPPRLWRDDEAATIAVTSGAGSDPLRLEVGLRLCGDAESLRRLLEALERDQADAGERLETGFAACRDESSARTEAMPAAGGAAPPLLIRPPDAPSQHGAAPELLVLSLQPRTADGGPGQALLGAASVHYVYLRGRF
jgi:hypothetical protein